MKTTRILFLVALGALSVSTAKALVAINLSAGELFQANGTTPVPDGTLIQLVACTSGTSFALPTFDSFTGNSANNVVIASFALDSSTFMTGSFSTPLTITLAGNLAAGDLLMVRWFPTLTTGASVPGSGTICGQYRTDMPLDGSSAWVMPADGTGAYTLNFQTIAAGGSVANSAGIANLTVVPEPSAYGFLGASVLGGIAILRRRRKTV